MDRLWESLKALDRLGDEGGLIDAHDAGREAKDRKQGGRLGATACPGKKCKERKNTAHQEWAPLGDDREVGVQVGPQGGLWHIQRTAREYSLGERG